MRKTTIASLLALPIAYSVGATLFERLYNPRIIRSIPTHNTIYLTFDDGPHPVYTPALLDLLKKYDATATFFVVGELAEKYPHILQRMVKEGHTIGIHHYTHTSSWQLTPYQLQRQIEKTAQVIEQATTIVPILYRPPWGHFNLATRQIAKKYDVILWSHIFKDWKLHDNHLAQLHEPIEDGAILLLHDNGDTKGADQQAPESMLLQLKRFLTSTTQKCRAIPV